MEDLDSVRKMTERNFSLQYLNAENRRFNGSSSYRENSRKIRRILKNEKYKGDVLQGKTYTTDPITHKQVVNMGEENMYYIKEHHQAIIEPELFDKVQQILEKRAGSREKGKRKCNYSRKYPFSSRIYCGFCGTVLTRRNWNSGTKNAAPVWHCMNFVKRGKTECPKCKAIKETIIENCFVEAYKILCSDKGDIVEKFINRMNNIITENSSDKLIENIEAEKQKLNSKINKLIDLSLDNAIDRDTFLERKEKLQTQIEQLNMKQEKLMLDERNNTNRKLSLNKIRKFLETGDIVTEFEADKIFKDLDRNTVVYVIPFMNEIYNNREKYFKPNKYELISTEAWQIYDDFSKLDNIKTNCNLDVKLELATDMKKYADCVMSCYQTDDKDDPYGDLDEGYKQSYINYKKIYDDIESEFYYIKVDNKIVGTTQSVYNNKICGIYSLAIKKEYRNKGIGKEVLKQQLQMCKGKKINIAYLQTELDFYPNKMYKKFGFKDLCTVYYYMKK